VHAPSQEKSVDSKDIFREELEQVFEYFTKYHMKFVLGYFNAIMEREDIFKQKILEIRVHIRIVIIMFLE